MNFSDALMDNNCMYKPIDLYIRTFSPNYKMERHKHDQVEIMYVKTGSFNVHIYDNKENETILHIYESQFLVIDINIEHYIEITTNVKILNLELLIKSNPYQPDVFKLSPILRRNENYTNFCKEMVGYGIFNADETFPDLLSLFIKAIQNGYNDNYDYTQSLLLALLLNIGNCYKNVKRNTYSYYTSMIINHINADLSNDLSISKLEKKLNVSKSYIHRCFKKDTGVSITEYLNKKRIAHARNLLINTNYSVMDICMECGFNNRQNFSYIFKKETGITPSEYRKKNTNKEFIAWLHLDQEGKIDL